MISVAEAEARILAGVRPTQAERIGLTGATGRVVATPVLARRTHPPRDVSAMDGYAVRASDLGSLPARLRVAMRAAG